MSARELQEQLNTLHEQLEQNPPLSVEEREHLHQLIEQVDAELKRESAGPAGSLADGVNLAVERFEVDHPGLAATLRNIGVALANMGI